MAEAGAADVPLIAKLERPLALEHLEEILDACDAVMVARGDLGLEMPLERVPRAQKEITAPRARRGNAGDRRDAGARVDDDRGAADPRRGERRRQRGRRWRRRDHAGGGDSGRRVSGARGADARRDHRRRGDRRRSHDRRRARPPHRRRRTITRTRCARRRSRSPTRGDAQAIVAVTRGGGDGASAVGAAAARADHRGDRARGHRRRLALYWGVVAVVHRPIGENVDEAGHASIGAAAGGARARRRRRRGRVRQHQPRPDPARRELPENPAL